MEFRLVFSDVAAQKLKELELDGSKKGLVKQIKKTLGYMETNLTHPSLKTHKFKDKGCVLGEVFESYVQNNTPGAYRVFWAYGPGRGQIYILAITPHP